MKKTSYKKLNLNHAVFAAVAVAAALGLAGIAATTLFVRSTLNRISNPSESSGAPVRIEGIDEALLDQLLQAQTEKISDSRRLPEPIANPFAVPAPPAPAPPPAPSPAPATPPAQ